MMSTFARLLVAGIAAAGMGVVPVAVAVAPTALAAPCADPAMCQAQPDCTETGTSSVCVRPGDAELSSQPDPNVIPEVPQANTGPWQVFGVPGDGRVP